MTTPTMTFGKCAANGVQCRMFVCQPGGGLTGLLQRNAETTKEPLADLEHEFRVPRHSVWLGAADGQHERYLRIPRCACRSDSHFVAGSSADGIDRSAHH